MYMIEIKEDKFDKAYEHVEKALKSMGKVMQCFSEWEEESGHYGGRGYGNRSNYGSRYGGGSMGYKEDDEWEDDDEMMGERRGGGRRRRSNGRYY